MRSCNRTSFGGRHSSTGLNGKARVLGAGAECIQVYSDSSGYGFGAHIEDDYFWGVWGENVRLCSHQENPPINEVYQDHINITELWPVVVAIHKWGVRWRNCSVMMVTDNTQVQGWVNTGRSTNPYAMSWLRELFWVSAFYNISIKSSRISSKDNMIADGLSRLNNEDCRSICDIHIPGFSACCRVVRAEAGMD